MSRLKGAARLLALGRRHRVVLVLRLSALVGTSVVAMAIGFHGYTTWAVVVAFIALAQVPSLVRFVERPSRELLRFLDSIRNEDFSVSFGRSSSSLPDALRAAFAEVSETFRRIRGEREQQAHFLQTVVRHVGVALIAYRDDGEVALFNEAAAKLLGVSRARSMERISARYPQLVAALLNTRHGTRTVVELRRNDEPMTLIVHATRFQLGGALTTLVSLQDIRRELEAKELEAWQTLTRVLTHEMVNSVAPIASLAATVQDVLGEEDGVNEQVVEALRVIRRRCDGLVQFVESYQSLARLPEPTFRVVPATELLGDVATLLGATARDREVDLTLEVTPPNLEFVADAEMFEQALVNVLLNAIESTAGRENASVKLRASVGVLGRPTVEVIDNGPGLIPEVLDSIFVPFFTTRPGGSGIGLSLAREIMRRHGGTLTVQSEPERETVFSFRF